MITFKGIPKFLAASGLVAVIVGAIALAVGWQDLTKGVPDASRNPASPADGRSPSQQVLYVYDGESSIAQHERARAEAQVLTGHLEHVVYYGDEFLSADDKALADIQVSIYKDLGIDARAEPYPHILVPWHFNVYAVEMEKAVAKRLGADFQDRIARQARARVNGRIKRSSTDKLR